MALDTDDDIQGLFDIVTTSNFIRVLYDKGMIIKLDVANEPKHKLLKEISQKLYPDELPVVNNILSYLTAPSVVQINANVTALDLTQLTAFSTLLDDPDAKDKASSFFKSMEIDNTIRDYVHSEQASFITTMSKATSVLQNINSGNYTELLRSVNLLKFFDNANKWTVTSIDDFIKSIPSKEIDDIIANIPVLSLIMPNFASFTATLNATTLLSYLTPANTFCNPCLVQFFGATSLKADIMSFLNTNVGDLNSNLNKFLSGLQQKTIGLNLKLGEIQADLSILQGLVDGISTLLTNLVAEMLGITGADKCSPLTLLVGLLGSLKAGIQTFLINPLKVELGGIQNYLGGLQGFLGAFNALKDLIPKLDC